MALCQNDLDTTESIKEAKALCTNSIQEAETHCSTATREAEVQQASQAGSIQQSHPKAIQHREEEAIEEESKGQLDFLSAYQAALRASPPKYHGTLIASYHVLLGHAPMSHLFSISQGASPSQQGSIPRASSPPAPTVPDPSPRPKWQHHSPDPMGVSSLSKATSKATPKGPPHLK